MVPWGGLKRTICNDPLSIAIPYFKNKPIVLDITMSKVVNEKIRLVEKKIVKCQLIG